MTKNKFVKLVRLVGFITKKFITMHGHMNVTYKLQCTYSHPWSLEFMNVLKWIWSFNSFNGSRKQNAQFYLKDFKFFHIIHFIICACSDTCWRASVKKIMANGGI